jgi:tetratricopeptide (TPR) repeat protein
MFAGLDDIPWADLEHAYGSAADVPGLIRQLLDPDEKVREEVMWTLYGNVFHQGSRYPATPYVIPFLIELCEDSSVPNRGELLRFWGSLITGYFSVRERPSWGDGSQIYFAGEITKVEPDDPFAAALHEIYRRSLSAEALLYRLLADEELTIRAESAWVLACLPTIAKHSILMLRQQLGNEPSVWGRAAIAFALGELGDATTLRRLNEEEHPAVRCMAACELARLAPTEELIDQLLQFIGEPIEGYQNVPGAGGSSAEDASFSVMYLPVETRRKAIPAISARLEHARSFATMPLAEALLSAAFESRTEPLTELNSLQRSVLLRMLNTQELWSIGNLSFTFKSYGLPHDREKCAALVGVKVAKDDASAKLSIAVTYADMGFLEKAREGIEKALSLDPAVFGRIPAPDECWLFCAKAFAETDPERALQAFDNARLINPSVVNRIGVSWRLAELLENRRDE